MRARTSGLKAEQRAEGPEGTGDQMLLVGQGWALLPRLGLRAKLFTLPPGRGNNWAEEEVTPCRQGQTPFRTMGECALT